MKKVVYRERAFQVQRVGCTYKQLLVFSLSSHEVTVASLELVFWIVIILESMKIVICAFDSRQGQTLLHF